MSKKKFFGDLCGEQDTATWFKSIGTEDRQQNSKRSLGVFADRWGKSFTIGSQTGEGKLYTGEGRILFTDLSTRGNLTGKKRSHRGADPPPTVHRPLGRRGTGAPRGSMNYKTYRYPVVER